MYCWTIMLSRSFDNVRSLLPIYRSLLTCLAYLIYRSLLTYVTYFSAYSFALLLSSCSFPQFPVVLGLYSRPHLVCFISFIWHMWHTWILTFLHWRCRLPPVGCFGLFWVFVSVELRAHGVESTACVWGRVTGGGYMHVWVWVCAWKTIARHQHTTKFTIQNNYTADL